MTGDDEKERIEDKINEYEFEITRLFDSLDEEIKITDERIDVLKEKIEELRKGLENNGV